MIFPVTSNENNCEAVLIFKRFSFDNMVCQSSTERYLLDILVETTIIG